ncbi:MAG: 6,7-dimethyl-8-ribityllumazine synthase [Vicinamibacterales bacterium]
MQRTSPEPGADLRADGLRFAIVVSRFNDLVTTRLRDAALATLVERGASRDTIVVHEVPGSFEIPQAARRVAETGTIDAIVCLGCLIRGATPHFEYIASAVAHGLTDASGETGVPMAFGVLTTNTVEEALERAGEGAANKGREAALAAIEMARLFRAIGRP